MGTRRIAIELDHGMGQKTRIYSTGVTIRGAGSDQPIHLFTLRRPDVVARVNGGPERSLHVTSSGALCKDPSWNTRFTLERRLVTCPRCLARMSPEKPPVTVKKLRVAIVEEHPDCGGKPQALFVMIDAAWSPATTKDDVLSWSINESHCQCSLEYARKLTDSSREERKDEVATFLALYQDHEITFVDIATKATWEEA